MLDRLRESKLSSDDMADILTVICVEPSVLKTWLLGIDNIRNVGAKELLRDFPNDAKNLGINKDNIENIDDFANTEPWQIKTIRDAYKSVVRTQFCLKMNGLDDLSQVGAIAFTNDTETADDWKLYGNSDVWTAWADDRGNNAVVKGAVKRGKTNFALLIAERFLARGRIVIGNILVSNAPKNYIYCPNVSTMFEAICHAQLNGQRVIIIFDEGLMFWTKIQTIMPKNIDMAKLILCYGKCDANVIYIGHYASDIPTAVIRTCVAEFEKMSMKNVLVNITDGIKMRSRLITSVPPTTLQYPQEQFQYFSLDLVISDLFEFLSKTPEGKNQWEMLLNYIQRHRGEFKEDSVEPKHVARFLKTKGHSVSEIAGILEEPRSTVGSWTKPEDSHAQD